MSRERGGLPRRVRLAFAPRLHILPFVAHSASSLTGKVIWITGASSGIGEALAYALSASGARLILSARRIERLDAVASRCRAGGASVELLPLDLSDPRSLASAVREAEPLIRTVDVLVDNAGVSQRSEALDTRLAVVRQIMETNFFGTIALTTEVARHMRERRGGLIVVVSSFVGRVGTPLRSSYAASKHALHGYFDSLRLELAKDHVDVLLVLPGFIRTEISLSALEAEGNRHGVMDPGQERGMSAAAAADRIVRAMVARKRQVTVGYDLKLRLATTLSVIAPALLFRLLRRSAVT